MKRFLCFLLFMLYLSFSAFAVVLDGQIHTRTEYKETIAILQSADKISNNAVSYAHLHWFNDPTNYSLYLAVHFTCKDFVPDGGKSGVEVTVNDILCTTFYADGHMDDVDPNFFDVESVFSIQEAEPTHIQNEMRIGIKYGYREDITVGIRILDCSGIPSNYYTYTVYTLPETSAMPVETTTEKTTTQKTTTTSTSAPSSTTTRKHTTQPIITAYVGTTTEPVTTKAAVSKTTKPTPTTASAPKTTRSKSTTTRKNKTNATTMPESENGTTAEQSESEAVLLCSDEATTVIDPQEAVSYKFYRMKSVGTALAASLVTAAVMISLFLGIGSKRRPHTPTPEEEHQDFG